MKKGIIITSLVIIFSLLVINLAIAELSERECKKNCVIIKNNNTLTCNSQFKECQAECVQEKQDCLKNSTEKRPKCNNPQCVRDCSSIKTKCLRTNQDNYLKCQKACKYIGKNITCDNGKYKAGEMFMDDCNLCECQYNSRISCKKTKLCNFEDTLLTKQVCESNGGFYQQLCNGPYFDIVCSKDNFCQCGGIKNYTCPNDYTCVYNFDRSITRKYQTISGFKTLLGYQLGEVGICAKKPVLPNCGNLVCEGLITETNPIGETIYNCPTDCVKI